MTLLRVTVPDCIGHHNGGAWTCRESEVSRARLAPWCDPSMGEVGARASFGGSDLHSHMARHSERPHTWFSALLSDVKFLITSSSQNSVASPGWRGSVDRVLTCEPNGCRFDSQSGHMPELLDRSPVGGVREAPTH